MRLYNFWNDRNLDYLQDKSNSKETEWVGTLSYCQWLKTRTFKLVLLCSANRTETIYYSFVRSRIKRGMKLLVEPNIIAVMLS